MSTSSTHVPSMKSTWSDVDDFFTEHLLPADDALSAAMDASVAEGLPPISVTPPQGKLLHLLARMCRARRILEIGTLGGYSTIWLARALPRDGKLITLEIDAHHADVARKNLERARLNDRVEIQLGPAAKSLATMTAAGVEPFDFVFVDADKASSDEYFQAALKLSHDGTVIVVDNVVRDGKVSDADSTDADILGIRRMTERLANEPRVSATAIQTVGGKSYDGFLLAIVSAT
ncbi:MAG: O-methyltransferase [Gemmatimonadetes bacterium]|nr:O-methyltransferase [Gemmatimonadota bacterium]